MDVRHSILETEEMGNTSTGAEMGGEPRGPHQQLLMRRDIFTDEIVTMMQYYKNEGLNTRDGLLLLWCTVQEQNGI